jgi:hypothetical protein
VENEPPSLTDTQYKKWLKDLKLPQHKMETLEKHLEKVAQWWQDQPDQSSKKVLQPIGGLWNLILGSLVI